MFGSPTCRGRLQWRPQATVLGLDLYVFSGLYNMDMNVLYVYLTKEIHTLQSLASAVRWLWYWVSVHS